MQGTIGRKLVENAKKITLFGEDIDVAAKIFTINGFSAHAGQKQLLDWLEPLIDPKVTVVLVHGEPKAQMALAEKINERFNLEAKILDYLEEMFLEGQDVRSEVRHELEAYPRVKWDFLTGEVERKWQMFLDQIKDIEAKPWADRKELEDSLLKMEFYLTRLLARM